MLTKKTASSSSSSVSCKMSTLNQTRGLKRRSLPEQAESCTGTRKTSTKRRSTKRKLRERSAITVPKKKAKAETREETNCGICLDTVQNRGRLSSCEHVFCTTCIKTWLKRSSVCPHCKREVKSVESSYNGIPCVEKIPKKVLKDTIEEEESPSVGRVVLVGQLNMSRIIQSRPVVYADDPFFNVLLGLRNSRPSANPVSRPVSTFNGLSTFQTNFTEQARFLQNVGHGGQDRTGITNSQFRNNLNQLLGNTSTQPPEIARQAYLEHCNFHGGPLPVATVLPTVRRVPEVRTLPFVVSSPLVPSTFDTTYLHWPGHF